MALKTCPQTQAPPIIPRQLDISAKMINRHSTVEVSDIIIRILREQPIKMKTDSSHLSESVCRLRQVALQQAYSVVFLIITGARNKQCLNPAEICWKLWYRYHPSVAQAHPVCLLYLMLI